MSEADPDELATLLVRARGGEPAAEQALFVRVYDELRGMARGYLRGRPGHTLQPTALVHEAFLRMVRRPDGFADRNHFIAVAATAMRQILVDHARRRAADKRGAGRTVVTLDDHAGAAPHAHSDAGAGDVVDLLALDQVLSRLAALSQRQARIVELRCFGGLTIDEVAEVLGVSGSLAEKEWRRARAWVRRELEGAAAAGDLP
ncbi:MAG TPA: ECF-type sigma factor [Kofleriaceae bacterium]|nr:ECF-type sigma factor [Kofleriaceae bacterium]